MADFSAFRNRPIPISDPELELLNEDLQPEIPYDFDLTGEWFISLIYCQPAAIMYSRHEGRVIILIAMAMPMAVGGIIIGRQRGQPNHSPTVILDFLSYFVCS